MFKLFIIINSLFMLLGSSFAIANELNIYSYRKPFLLKPFLDEYSKKTNIKFNVLHLKKGMAQRLLSEGKNTKADIILTVDISRITELKDYDLLKSINSKVINNNVPDHLVDSDNKWVALSTRARIIGVSKSRVNKDEIKRIEDLANPQFKNKICTRKGSHPYNRALLSSIISHNGYEKALIWAKGLVNNFARKPQGNDRAQAKAIFSGECDIVLMNTYYFGLMKFNTKNPEQQKWADATDIIFFNQNDRGQHINVSAGAISKHSKNSKESLKFLEWLTSKKAQKIYSEINYEYPVNKNIKPSGKITMWGSFKSDEINITTISKNAPKAKDIIDKVGW